MFIIHVGLYDSVFFFAIRCIDRMFTSRSEYRITLRSDNADLRLTPKARALAAGIISDRRWEEVRSTQRKLEDAIEALKACELTPQVCCFDIVILKYGLF